MISAALALALSATAGNAIAADEQTCDGLLPDDAVAASEVFLCDNGAGAGQFACRDYQANGHSYRVLLRGGTVPRQAFELASRVSAAKRLHVGGRSCAQARPQNLPAASCLRGTGVCQDERGRPLPCSVFEYSADGKRSAPLHYLVYYEPDGRGVRRIDAVLGARSNHDFEAELAFAIGQALDRSDPERATAYLEHAAAMAPGNEKYLAARPGVAETGAASLHGTPHEAPLCAAR